MAVIQVDAERTIAATPDDVYRCIVDYKDRHPRWLPSNYSDYAVEQGGAGAGTIFRYLLTVGNRARTYHMAVAEPQPGTVVTESDTGSTLVSTWRVTPQENGTRVTLHTEWQGHGGVGGFFERLFAPPALKRVYDAELAQLDAYATAALP